LTKFQSKKQRIFIDCDAEPLIPTLEEFGGTRCRVVWHDKGGQWELDPSRIYLYLSERLQNGESCIGGDDLQEELEGKLVLNANVLDYLLYHQGFIPEEWRRKHIFFWGTKYYSASDGRLVRYLYSRSGVWTWGYNGVENAWTKRDLSAIRR